MILFVIFLSLFLGINLRSTPVISLLIISYIFIRLFLKHKRKLLLMITGVFFVGFGISFIHINFGERENYEGIVYEVKDNYFLLNSGGEKLYCYSKNHDFEIGDIINIKGYKNDLSFSILESNFDFEEYLNDKGVFGEIKIQSIKNIFHNPIRLKSFRNYFINKFNEDTGISVNSILFSDHDDNEINNNISSIHLSRLINAGGLYFYAFYGVLFYLINIKVKKKWAKIIAISIMSFYLILTYPRFSILRLVILFILRWINKYILKDRFNNLEVLSISGITFLIIDYSLALQDSFVLGYFLPIFIYFINNSFNRIKGIKKKLFLLSIIYLFFIPFELKYFNSLTPLSPIYQLVLSPIFILFFFISILCLYGLPLYGLANIYNSGLIEISKFFSFISFEIYVPPLSEIGIIIYYLLFFSFLYYLSIGFKKIYQYILLTYISTSLIFILPIQNMVSDEVTFINVGQGDATFIRNKNRNILIDTGGLKYIDLAKDSLIPFFKKRRVYSLDLVITTHNDFDHNGALTSLRKNFRIKKEMTNFSFSPIKIGTVSFINYNNHINDLKDDNDKSLVIGFSLANTNYLITGDAPKSVENYIMNEYKDIKCDILKVGHHGSNTSSSDAFIKYLKPKIGIISCGENNKYGHPNKEVINILKNNNVEIRRTDLEGSISFISYFS